MNDYTPSDYGRVRGYSDADGWTLVFVRELPHPPAKVWDVLTQPDQLSRWAPFTADHDLSEGGEATLTMLDDGAAMSSKDMIHQADPPRLLEYSWGGSDRLRWELTSTAEGTRLELRHTMTQPEPMIAAGWHLCLDVADRLLSGDPIPPIRGEDAKNFGFEALRDEYVRQLRDNVS